MGNTSSAARQGFGARENPDIERLRRHIHPRGHSPGIPIECPLHFRSPECFIINEAIRRNAYSRTDYQLSYLRTKDDLEIDLILEKRGLPKILVEIQSARRVDERKIEKLRKLKADLGRSELWVVSREDETRSGDFYEILPWREFFSRVFT